jgi:basic membrane protein A
MCWLAAKLSQSGVIGMVGVDEVPFNTETHDGCRAGAEDGNADVEVVETFAGDFFDLQRGREAAQTAVDQGADVLFVSGGSDSSIGALNLCEDEDLICMGVVANDHDMAPNALVTSANIDWKPFLRQWIAAAATGELEPAVWDASFQNGALFALPFEGPSAEKVPNEVREEFAAMLDQLANGEIDLPESEAHPGYP